MKINWKLRLQNKTTLVTLITLGVTFIYQILSFFGVVPTVSQEEVINAILLIVNIFVVLGVVVDPTTEGVSDSTNALEYETPKKSIEETEDEANG